MSRPDSDVLVIGAGPAGIAAACAAAETGARTVLLDENVAPGGQIWRVGVRRGRPRPARRWDERLARSGAHLESGTTVFDLGPRRAMTWSARGTREWSAHSIVLATGATERFLPFPGWTLPGVVGLGGLQALLKEGLDLEGRAVLLSGSGPLLGAVGALALRAGARIIGVHEQAPRTANLRLVAGLWRQPEKWLDAAGAIVALPRLKFRHDAFVTSVERLDGGRLRVHSLVGGRATTVEVDWLACSYGLVPHAHAAALVGCEREEDGRVTVDDLQQSSVPGVYVAGEPSGVAGWQSAVAEGWIAGRAAARAPVSARWIRRRDAGRRFADQLRRAFPLRDELRARITPQTLVCRCEDVPAAAIEADATLRDLKLRTRCGMGPCQGRVCSPVLAFLGVRGADRVRPPLVPVPCSALAAAATVRPPAPSPPPVS